MLGPNHVIAKDVKNLPTALLLSQMRDIDSIGREMPYPQNKQSQHITMQSPDFQTKVVQ